MTYDDKLTNGMYAINSYTWKLLQANMGWTSSNYKGARPIIPSAQQPEFMEIGKSFIVYTSMITPAPDLWMVTSETLAYTIYSKSTTEADHIANILYDTFKRQDEAARDVNEWIDTERAGSKLREVSFTNIRATMTDKSNAKDEESGYYNALFMAIIQYHNMNGQVPQTNGFTYP